MNVSRFLHVMFPLLVYFSKRCDSKQIRYSYVTQRNATRRGATQQVGKSPPFLRSTIHRWESFAFRGQIPAREAERSIPADRKSKWKAA